MVNEAENPPSTSGEKSSGATPSAPGWASYLIVGAAALGVGALVYYFVERGSGRIPPMPRVSFTEQEVADSIGQLEKRAAMAGQSDADRPLLEMLERLHRAETTGSPNPELEQDVRTLMKTVAELAATRAARDPDGYAALGDRLALKFHEALGRALARAGNEGMSRVLRNRGPEIDEALRLGGSFALKAVERGLVDEQGKIDGPAVLPQALFRYRWGILAGRDPLADLSPTDQRAVLDFLVVFTNPRSYEIRLEAADRLLEIDPRYDHQVARALVLHEAGRDGEALEELAAAIEAGRKDEIAAELVRALRP